MKWFAVLTRPPRRYWGYFWLSYLMAGMALIPFGYFAAPPLWASYRARAWPTVTGVIRGSYLRSNPSFPDRKAKALFAEYTFVVEGKHYVGTNVRASPQFHRIPDDDPAKYAAGAAVRVHYNPENVEECCLDPRPPARLFVFALLSLLGVASAIQFVRLNRAAPDFSAGSVP